MIDWKLIDGIPDELKDGREVLIFDHSGATVCKWSMSHPVGWDSGFTSEIDGYPIMIEFPTHFAEINLPDH